MADFSHIQQRKVKHTDTLIVIPGSETGLKTLTDMFWCSLHKTVWMSVCGCLILYVLHLNVSISHLFSLLNNLLFIASFHPLSKYMYNIIYINSYYKHVFVVWNHVPSANMEGGGVSELYCSQTPGGTQMLWLHLTGALMSAMFTNNKSFQRSRTVWLKVDPSRAAPLPVPEEMTRGGATSVVDETITRDVWSLQAERVTFYSHVILCHVTLTDRD